MSYPIVQSNYSVETLPIHLPNEATLIFLPGDENERLENKKHSKLEAFLKQCLTDNGTFKDVTYKDLPKSFTWHRGKGDEPNEWRRRQRQFNKLGRINPVSPRNRELYSLWKLLMHTECPQGWVGLRTVDGTVMGTFYEAAYAKCLITSEQAWADGIKAIVNRYHNSWRTRRFFAMLIANCGEGPHIQKLWNDFKEEMLPPSRSVYPNLEAEQEHRIQREQIALRHLNYLVLRFSGNDLTYFGIDISHVDMTGFEAFENMEQIPQNDVLIEDINALLLSQAPDVITDEFRHQAYLEVEGLMEDQRAAYDFVNQALEPGSNASKLLLVNGNAGTGKTHFFKVLNKYLRCIGIHAIFCASTGVAATLLPDGRTAHSTFALPRKQRAEVPQLSANDLRAKRLLNAKVIIWDEISQQHKINFTQADRILRDLTGINEPFGGKIMVLGVDFQQILPVVIGGNNIDAVEACFKRHELYLLFTKVTLYINKRVNPDEREFVELLNDVGSGRTIDPETGTCPLPASMFVSSAQELQDAICDAEVQNNPDEMKNRGLMAPTNNTVDAINHQILTTLQGGRNNKVFTFYGVDRSFEETSLLDEAAAVTFNKLTPSGMPPHKLEVKIGSVLMLIVNVSVRDGLVNGTRLILEDVLPGVLICRVITGMAEGKIMEFPTFVTEYEDELNPAESFRRLQFPFRLSSAMTINKSQGQSLKHVGINLERDVFQHGGLYVALSRATTQAKVKIYLPENRRIRKPNDPDNIVRVKNVVMRDILED